jgi:hypothetical protein
MTGSATIVGLRKKYVRLRILETTLFAGGVGGTVWAIGFWIRLDPYLSLIMAAAAASVVAFFRIRKLGLHSMDNERISYFLNKKFPQLQDSSDLLIRAQHQLSPLEQIQVGRTERALDTLDDIRLPHYALLSVLVFVIGVALAVLSTLFETGTPIPAQATDSAPAVEQPAAVPSAAELASHSLTIKPPAYTGLASSSSGALSATVPEASELTWAVNFTTPPQAVHLHFSNGDSASMTKVGEQFALTRKFAESMIYQVKWESLGVIRSSDYFEIRVRPDGAPLLNIKDLQQFTRLGWDERTSIEVPVVLQDDYGLSRGHIVATVSKGSGESVKFREERLAFDSPASVRGKNISARRRIDFRKLGMEPGDEIYFYAEAWDNKQPGPQRARTETFFISLQDTASSAIVADASLGVDLMPDYFRSQRQIIIDTEKLLKDQPNISRQQFNATSNELGYDQKVLRLKYGQFLGEEFETAIGAPAHAEAEEDDEDEDDPAKKFGHQHDKENEHNLVPEKKPTAGHEHEDDEDESDPMAAFKHNHDNMEEATFFTQSVRSKLKAALTLMWDAELQLRLYAPKESLPIQYKILNLLKEISQDSRIYVHRMGFDPPPLKEDKRLTGDLDEIGSKETAGIAAKDKPYPAIRKALVGINMAIESNRPVGDEQFKSDLHDAATEIAAVSITRPGSYLVQLSMIKSVIDGNLNESEYIPALLEIRHACWQILPYEDPGPGQMGGTRHPLDAGLLKKLKSQSNE